MILDYFRLILKDIKGRKFASFLTFFAISLGILSIFTIILVSQGFQQSLEKQFEQLGTNNLIVQADGSSLTNYKKGLTDNEVKLIENKPYVKDVYPHYIKTVQLQYANDYATRMVLAVPLTEKYFIDYNTELAEGRFPKEGEKNVMVIGPLVKTDIFKKDVKLGSNIYIKDTKFKVIGILKSVGNPEDDKNIYLDMNTLRNIYDAGNQVNLIFVKIEEGYDVDLAAENLKILLENKLGKDTVNIQTFAQLVSQVNSILGIVQATLGGIALVSLIVGAVGIINTMYVIITEKTKDIGIMKSIGAKNTDIFTIYILQAGFFGFLGAILGIIFGSIGALGFGTWAQQNGFTFLEITINPIVVITLLIFGFGIGALSGFLPAYKASKLIIVDTLRK